MSAVLTFTTVTPAFAEQPPVPPGYRPAPDSDEAGLWMQGDEAERRIQTLPQLVRDKALNEYVKKLVCKLAGDYCGDIRVYILDVPLFNASMAPNGMMIVYTGTLLRCDNEAQLAFVLAHEIAHFKKRHGLDQWHNAVNTTGAMAVLGVVSAGAGVFGLIGLLAEMGMAAGFTSYTRDQEREADAIGFDLATANGYDPRQAALLWTNITTEDEADPAIRNRNTFLSSHPQSK
jgi:predicted Zn-dependent protease